MPQAITPIAMNQFRRGSDVKRQWENYAARSNPALDYSTMYGPTLAEQDEQWNQYWQFQENDRQNAYLREAQRRTTLAEEQFAAEKSANRLTNYTQMAGTAAVLGKETGAGAYLSNLAGRGVNKLASATGYTSPMQQTISTTPLMNADGTPFVATTSAPSEALTTGGVTTSSAGEIPVSSTTAGTISSTTPAATTVAPSTAGTTAITADSAEGLAATSEAMGFTGGEAGAGATGMGESVGSSAGANAGAQAGSEALSMASGVLGAAAIGYTAYTVADTVQKTHWGNEMNNLGARIGRGFGGPELSNEAFAAGGRGGAAGAAAGWYIGGAWGGLIGFVIGAVVGAGWRSIGREHVIPGQTFPGTNFHILPTISLKHDDLKKEIKDSVTHPWRLF